LDAARELGRQMGQEQSATQPKVAKRGEMRLEMWLAAAIGLAAVALERAGVISGCVRGGR
jgi:hypothetical protein